MLSLDMIFESFSTCRFEIWLARACGFACCRTAEQNGTTHTDLFCGNALIYGVSSKSKMVSIRLILMHMLCNCHNFCTTLLESRLCSAVYRYYVLDRKYGESIFEIDEVTEQCESLTPINIQWELWPFSKYVPIPWPSAKEVFFLQHVFTLCKPFIYTSLPFHFEEK